MDLEEFQELRLKRHQLVVAFNERRDAILTRARRPFEFEHDASVNDSPSISNQQSAISYRLANVNI